MSYSTCQVRASISHRNLQAQAQPPPSRLSSIVRSHGIQQQHSHEEAQIACWFPSACHRRRLHRYQRRQMHGLDTQRHSTGSRSTPSRIIFLCNIGPTHRTGSDHRNSGRNERVRKRSSGGSAQQSTRRSRPSGSSRNSSDNRGRHYWAPRTRACDITLIARRSMEPLTEATSCSSRDTASTEAPRMSLEK